MVITDSIRQHTEVCLATARNHAYAVSARYDQRTQRVMVHLHTGLELAIPPALVEGLVDATPEALAEIEISPTGLGCTSHN